MATKMSMEEIEKIVYAKFRRDQVWKIFSVKDEKMTDYSAYVSLQNVDATETVAEIIVELDRCGIYAEIAV